MYCPNSVPLSRHGPSWPYPPSARAPSSPTEPASVTPVATSQWAPPSPRDGLARAGHQYIQLTQIYNFESPIRRRALALPGGSGPAAPFKAPKVAGVVAAAPAGGEKVFTELAVEDVKHVLANSPAVAKVRMAGGVGGSGTGTLRLPDNGRGDVNDCQLRRQFSRGVDTAAWTAAAQAIRIAHGKAAGLHRQVLMIVVDRQATAAASSSTIHGSWIG